MPGCRRRGNVAGIFTHALVCHRCADEVRERRDLHTFVDHPAARAPRRVNTRDYTPRENSAASSNVLDVTNLPRASSRGTFVTRSSLANDPCEFVPLKRHDDAHLDRILWWLPEKGHCDDDPCDVVLVKRHDAGCPSRIRRSYRPAMHDLTEPVLVARSRGATRPNQVSSGDAVDDYTGRAIPAESENVLRDDE